MNEAELIKRCLAKEAAAQQIFVEHYGKKIMVVCHRYATLTVEPSDLFQEAFIQIFSVLHQFDASKGSIEGWIYRIAVNQSLKLIKKSLKYDQASSIEDVSSVTDLTTELNDTLGYKELLGFIKQLPEMQQLVFNLYVIDGYSHDEIAKQLAITASTSRSQLTRAKVKLKKMHSIYHE